MKAHVSGIGWVTPAGMGGGRGGVRFALGGAELPAISRRDVFAEPDRRFGRMDEFSRLGLAAITFALRDAGLERWQEKRPIGLIAQSTCGCLATDFDYFDTVMPQGGVLASPHLFAYTLSNTFLGEAAIRFGLTGTQFIVSEATGDGLAALRMALESLDWGEEETMLAGVCDIAVPPSVKHLSDGQPGAVFFVLEKAPRDGIVSYGEIALEQDRAVFAGAKVDDIPGLVRGCLSRLDAGPTQDKTA